MNKRTKILATIGPSTDSLEMIEALIHAGVNLFRLNFSHGSHEYHLGVLNKIRTAMENTGLLVGVLQDISGPKIRIGELQYPFELHEEDTITFSKTPVTGKSIGENHYVVSINYPEILDQLNIDDHVFLYDGIIRTKVISVDDLSVVVTVENHGRLSSKKGVNFPNTHLGVEILTEKDREDIAWGVANNVDFMAISFVQDAQDMIHAREIVASHGGTQQLIAKIEKFDAIENIDAILEASDGLMVARGDLGIEVPYYEVPNIQKMLIFKANNAAKPIITATQMLLSMTHSERATRAEISDIANAVLDGTDAVMLSEESAVGEYPILAVETMASTIREVEKQYPYHKFHKFERKNVSDGIDEAAVRLSRDLDAGGILSFTTSGASSRKLARYRPIKPIYAITHDEHIAKQLTLTWGVHPLFSFRTPTLETMVAMVIQNGLKAEVLDRDRTYILAAGDRTGITGSTNMIRVLRKHELDYFNMQEEEHLGN
jgi:pyruvate kinase